MGHNHIGDPQRAGEITRVYDENKDQELDPVPGANETARVLVG